MNKWNLIIDVDKCCNCGNCAMAMKDEYVGNDFPGYAASQPLHGHEWIKIERHTRGQGALVDVTYVPRTCNHCDDAPCIAAGDGAVSKRPDGIVVIDPVKAKGNRELVAACPYGAIWWNEESQLPQHWIFDAHLIDKGWQEPRCVQVCPTGALSVAKVTDDAMAKRAAAEGLEVSRPELKTKPRVYYKGLARVGQVFVGGNLSAVSEAGIVDNVAGADIQLSVADRPDKLGARSDEYGDFKIDGLVPSGATFRLRAVHPEFGAVEFAGTLDSSHCLDSLILR